MIKIVSGGQTGVDRGALDAAIARGFPYGGWCPEGRKAEDGVIPRNYSMTELPGAGYRQRTKRNVIDSDGTVIIYFGFLKGGTEQTVMYCIKERKPYLLLDAEEIPTKRASQRILDFIRRNGVSILNVAGPRAGEEPRGHEYAEKAISGFLNMLKGSWTE